MLKSLAHLIVLAGLMTGCGRNQVTVEIRGCDGNLVRLDANELVFRYNHLVPSGTYTFPVEGSNSDIRSGTYQINLASNGHLQTQQLVVERPPFIGLQEYSLSFEVPSGKNAVFRPEGTIVYAATPSRVRQWDLFTIKADGTDKRRLTDSREFQQHPQWSPDGSQIVYTQGDMSTSIDLWVMDADGSNRRRLTEHPERDQRAAWSPDGTQLAWVSHRDGTVAIWTMDVDGGNKRKLAQGREPAWSPDGRRIVFTSAQYDGWDEIYSIDVDGNNLQRMTFQRNTFDVFPRFSHNGGRIAFGSERFGGQELMLMLPDGSGQTRITVAENTFNAEPVWSPCGLGLAYAGKMPLDEGGNIITDSRGRPVGTWDIYVVAATGFDWDQTDRRDVLPVNLTRNEDWDEVSPSWRSY